MEKFYKILGVEWAKFETFFYEKPAARSLFNKSLGF
jgi:hypothetical protein